jgi:two-component system response regulator NreC
VPLDSTYEGLLVRPSPVTSEALDQEGRSGRLWPPLLPMRERPGEQHAPDRVNRPRSLVSHAGIYAGPTRSASGLGRRHGVRSCVVMALDAEPITIVLADDHAVVRSGLRMVLDREEDFEVVSEAADADSALRTVLGHKPSILVLDLNMPGEPTSLEAIPRVQEVSPGTRVVVLTMQEDPEFARRALRAGAAGYVLKEAADDELVDAVRRVAGGATYLNPRLGAVLAAAPPEPAGPPDDLTEREVGVLRLIALGHTNAEIAQDLSLSVRTVESHRAHIQQKLGRSTRAELVRYALDHGLVGPE